MGIGFTRMNGVVGILAAPEFLGESDVGNFFPEGFRDGAGLSFAMHGIGPDPRITGIRGQASYLLRSHPSL